MIVTWVPRIPGNIPDIEAIPHSGITYRGSPIKKLIQHTWAQDVLTLGDFVIPIPTDAPKDVSCIIGCAVLTGAGAVLHTVRVRAGDAVAVFGAGGVGLSAIQMAEILGAYPVIAVDLQDDKLEFAKEFGATHLINATQTNPVDAIRDITSGGVEYAFDTIGYRATDLQILEATRPGGTGPYNRGGTAVLVGMPQEKMTVDLRHFEPHQRSYTGANGPGDPEKDFPLYLRLQKEGRFPLERLVSRRFRLEQVNEACAALDRGEILGRAIFDL